MFQALSGSQTATAQVQSLSSISSFTNTVSSQARIFAGSGGSASAGGGGMASAGPASSGPVVAMTDIDMMTTASISKPSSKSQSATKSSTKPVAQAPVKTPARTWRVWSSFMGGMSEVDANSVDPSVSGNDTGMAAGFDYALTPEFLAGVAVAGSSSSFSVGGGTTSGDITGGHFSLYGVAKSGALYASGSLTYSRLATESTRTVTGLGPTEKWNGDYATNGYSADLEVGWQNKVAGYTITPFAGIKASVMQQEAYTETSDDNAALLGLSYNANDTESLPGSLGVQVERDYGLQDGWMLTGMARAALVHEFRTARSISANFINLPGSSFTVDGSSPPENVGRVMGGINLVNKKGTTLFANLTGDLSSNTRTYVAQGGFKLDW